MLPSYENLSAFEMSVSAVLRLKIWNDVTVRKGGFKFACYLLFPKLVFPELIIVNGYTAVEIVLDTGDCKLCPVDHCAYREIYVRSRRLEDSYVDDNR